MILRELAARFRRLADDLDALLGADQVVQRRQSHKQNKKIATIRRKLRKGYSYHGKHWTQQPENRGRLLKMVKRSVRTRSKGVAS